MTDNPGTPNVADMTPAQAGARLTELMADQTFRKAYLGGSVPQRQEVDCLSRVRLTRIAAIV